MLKKTLLCSALAAFLLPGTVAKAQSPWSTGFKFGVGNSTGDLKQVRNNGMTLSGLGEVCYGVRPGSSIVMELGFRYLPSSEIVVSQYKAQWVSVPATSPLYYRYPENSVLQDMTRKTDAEGLQMGVLFRQTMFDESFYVQGGIRAGFYKTREVDAGTQITTGVRAAGAPSTTATPIIKIETIDSVSEKKKVSPQFVLGAGYEFYKNYCLELNVSNAKIESAATGTKSGLLIDLAYRIKF